MPEMVELVDRIEEWRCAHFNTCAYEPDVPLGEKHYKPQMLGGTLPGICNLNRVCACGNRPHEPIIGKDKSSKSAAYPWEFCKAYGELAAKHFMNMAKTEFLEGRLILLEDRIAFLKGSATDVMHEVEDLEELTKKVERSSDHRRGLEHKRKRAEEPDNEDAEASSSGWDPSEGVDWSRSSSQERDVAEAEPATEATSSNAPDKPKVELRPKASTEDKAPAKQGEKEALQWKGGQGKHGLLREPRAKDEVPKALTYLGGMRDPHKAVVKLPTLQSQGVKLWERWRKFAVHNPGILEVAESYGTESCRFNEELLVKWRAELCDLWGVPPPGERELSSEEYRTPVYHEVLRGWVKKSGDPDDVVADWLRDGAPLGIECPIVAKGVFPPSDEAEEGDDVRTQVVADAVLGRPDTLKNYKSVEDDLEEANVELDRYANLGYMKRIPREEAEQLYEGGTVSRLGLVLKVKDDGSKKRRIVIDLRRSGGNAKSVLPEKLVLPRLTDGVRLIKEVRKRSTKVSDPAGEDELELALVDVADAFTVLPVAKAELKHTMAPSTKEGEMLVFQALLFGYKVAPLLYSRFAALVARLLQGAIKLNRGGHEVYLDDSLWVLQGTLAARTNTLAFILNTMGALGIRVSLSKGSRANKAIWIGVTMHLVDKNTLVIGIPIKFIDELKGILAGWAGAGYAPLKELRVVAGKGAWLGGVLPRARWTTSVFYAVLSQTLKEEEQEKAPTTRNRRGLFAVKRLELARLWLISFLEAAKLRPMRRVALNQATLADIRVTTDASPEALGGHLMVNGRIIAAFYSEVDKKQAEELLLEHLESSSQSALEALAILVALRRWAEKLKGAAVAITVQSDSITALALTQKLAAKSSSPGLNFLGAELAICLEEMGVEEIKPIHIPGKANVEADFLSRPSTWKTATMPSALEGVDIGSELGPGNCFYRLPTPKEAPSLWGAQGTAAGSIAVWDAVC